MMRLLVIADDFTGALDTGIQFSSYGIRSYVLFELRTIDVTKESVMIYNADTRHKTKDEAYKTIKAVVTWARENNIDAIYKKTDSALRGNIGIELQGILDIWHDGRLVFAPAYPEMSRFTKNGIQYIDGVPVAESCFGSDLYEPVLHSSVEDIIHETSNIEVCRFDGGLIDKEHFRGVQVVDAESCEDLDKAADWCVKNVITVFAGCAGFAKSLAKNFFKNTAKRGAVELSPILLGVCGSVHPVTKEQISIAKNSGIDSVSINKRYLIDSEYLSSEKMHRWCAALSDACKNTGSLLIDVETEPFDTAITGKDYSLGEKIAGGLAAITEQILDTGIEPTLFCTGGDTLLSITRKLGVKQLQLLEEIYPGVVLSRVHYKGSKLDIISKSGGFGSPSLLLDLKRFLEQYKQNEMEKIYG